MDGNQLMGALFAVLMISSVLWLILVIWMFRRLRTRHPAVYDSMGKPDLFWNNSTRSMWLFMRFLWSSHPRVLGDRAMQNVARTMQLLFVCYMAAFAGMVCLFFKPR